MIRRKLLYNNTGGGGGGSHSGGSDVSPSILITVLILAIAVILSASLYLLLRFLRRHRNSTTITTSTSTTVNLPHSVSTRRVSPTNPLLDALPLFTFDALKSTGDCAVCLSKFEEKDLLRLLPICCHVFHADCIDTWLNSNQSCPLCRSPVFLPESSSNDDPLSLSSSSHNSRSFRVEIGNVSQRNSAEIPVRRTYSLGGNFDYIVNDDDVVSEIHSGSFRRTSSTTEFKVDDHYPSAALAAGVGTRGGSIIGGGWLKDYLSHSLSSSFRGSGRWFFTGSSRRETTTEFGGVDNRVNDLDLEASRLGDEIGELFRWLSGV
ncbi:E3 ubiquitin-protein ligase ATL4-like [Chenopodium quinoa]|uniref:RING-type domain-containing protein n=1 Tax=Chenopodium quinoa TaxID=63459 RepID=A0A803LII9_CHEQI|nr:E3 ubiquitin-protein ligase ATL4-like [Chenopodium quinoa]